MTRGTIRRRVAVLIGSIGLVLASVAPAAAAAQTRSVGIVYHGATDTSYSFDVSGTCDTCIPDLFGALIGPGSWAYGATATGIVDHVDWQAATATDLRFDDALLRQGQTLDLNDKLIPTVGTITATGSVQGAAGLLNDPTGGTNFGASGSSDNINHAATWTAACAMPLPGDSPRTCVSGTQDIPLAEKTVAGALIGSLKIVLSVQLRLEFTIDSDGIVAARAVTVTGGSGSLDRTITFVGSTPSTVADPVALSCTQPAGSDVVYSMSGQAYAPTSSLAGRGTLHAAAVISPIIGPDVEVVGANIKTITAAPSGVAISLAGGNGSATLGALAKNNIPPTPDAGGGGTHAYSGVQGTPVVFDGSGSSSPCGFPTLRWDFSDGGVAFGKSPRHTFQGSGLYSGLLTATDATGLTSSQTFSVSIDNLAPVVDAGPDSGAAWGRLVTFNGAATDPGADDQSTLRYAWDFGDGTPPIASGGSSVFHAYATPATYTATLTVCDRLNACSSDSRSVVVRKRDVSLGSIGDTAATFDTAARLRASLVDEFGVAVNGRTLTFSVNGAAAGSAVTNSAGMIRL